MKPINTLPIEDFIDAARIATKSNKQTVILSIKEAQALSDSLATIMTRLAGIMDQTLVQNIEAGPIQIKMDGGGF
jgi:hypothetical protein